MMNEYGNMMIQHDGNKLKCSSIGKAFLRLLASEGMYRHIQNKIGKTAQH